MKPHPRGVCGRFVAGLGASFVLAGAWFAAAFWVRGVRGCFFAYGPLGFDGELTCDTGEVANLFGVAPVTLQQLLVLTAGLIAFAFLMAIASRRPRRPVRPLFA